jgi:hypothetical protein
MGYRWTAAAAHAYYDALPWQSGCNFAPSYAINQLEMWQEETFDIEAIDAELALAASVGMNAVRVYLHDLLWLQDADGIVRFLLGSRPGSGAATRAETRSAQQRMGAGPRDEGTCRP